MELALPILFFSLFALLALGIPVVFSLGLSAFASLLTLFPAMTAVEVVAQKTVTAFDSFGLLAIPFFILAGQIMNRGGIARRLVDLAAVFVSFLPGALAHVNILANMLFGAISGSAVSSAAAVGGIMSPIQSKQKYDEGFSAAVNIASCPSGLLIPPSNILILYSLISGGTSVAALFVAGYLPGFLMGFGLMLVTGFLAWRKGITGTKSEGRFFEVLWRAIPSLSLIIVVIGGLLAGVFTATEASAIAVLYALILAMVYKEIDFVDLPSVVLEATVSTCLVLFLVGTSMALSWVIAITEVPLLLSALMGDVMTNPILALLILNIVLLVAGTFMDMTPAVLIFTPIFLPLAESLGLHPVHFGIVLVFNLCIGICTPPVGSALFVGCSVAKVSVEKALRHLWPLYAVLILCLLIVTYFPWLSLWLPKWMGLI